MNEPLYTAWFDVAESHEVVGNETFSLLLAHIKADIIALEINGESVFKQVGCFVSEPKAMLTPACAIHPMNDYDEPNGIGNLYKFVNYRFAIGIGVKGSQDDKIIDDVFKCRSAVKEYFENKAGYDDVSGHIGTTVEVKDINYDGEAPSGVLLFGSGIEIICKVQE